jgi:hypothetical protein
VACFPALACYFLAPIPKNSPDQCMLGERTKCAAFLQSTRMACQVAVLHLFCASWCGTEQV